MRSLLAGLALAAFSTPAAAEEWYYIGDSDDGILYADADSVRSVGNMVRVLGFVGFAEPTGDGSVFYIISQFEYRCAAGQFRTVSSDAYDEDHQYVTTDSEAGEWGAISPDSFAAGLKAFACDGARDEAVANPFDDADDYFYGW